MPEDQYGKVFANNLNYYMNKIGMNQQDLIKALKEKGISVGSSTVSYWCSGKKTPRADNFDALCDVLGVMRSDLLADNSQNENYKMDVSPIERSIIEKYRSSDELTRQMVQKLLDVDGIKDAEKKLKNYAELYGDIKKPGIKSPGDNITGYYVRCNYRDSNQSCRKIDAGECEVQQAHA